VRPHRESGKRYILRCESCAFEVLRRRAPRKPTSCPRCNHRHFDARFLLSIYEIVALRPAEKAGARVSATAASAAPPRH
jgi:hypothetical protein